jgi:hypothetical protein
MRKLLNNFYIVFALALGAGAYNLAIYFMLPEPWVANAIMGGLNLGLAFAVLMVALGSRASGRR